MGYQTASRKRVGLVRRCLGPVGIAGALVAGTGVACSSLPPVQSIRAARHYAAGTRALDRGDAAVAIAELERAAALRPAASEIRNHLGLAYWSGGREGAALRELERAVELDCDNEAARVNLARLQRARGVDGATNVDAGGGVDAVERSGSDGG